MLSNVLDVDSFPRRCRVAPGCLESLGPSFWCPVDRPELIQLFCPGV